MKLTVATWNMDHWKRTPALRRRAWEHLRSAGYDVALIQEAAPPPDCPRESVVWRSIGRYRRFGSGVVNLTDHRLEEVTTARPHSSYVHFPLTGTIPGSVGIARIHPPGVRPVVFVSVYAAIEDGYSMTTVFRQVADLIPLFDSVDGDRVVLGGDLNISTQSTDDLARQEAAFAAIESLGLVNLLKAAPDRPQRVDECPCERDDCFHVVTHRNSSGWGGHLDYLFASEDLARECTLVRLDDSEAMWELSDHCPVVAEFELQPPVGPLPWSERHLDDVEDTIRAVLAEPRDWGIWTPGDERVSVGWDRKRTRWIAAGWEGTLADGRPASIELGIWRERDAIGHDLVAHAGFLGKPVSDRIDDIQIQPEGADVTTVTNRYATYVIVPVADGSHSPEAEMRRALDQLMGGARL